MDLLSLFAETFNIPTIKLSQKTWFFRTKAGLLYQDFINGNYIELGWDLVDAALIKERNKSNEEKKKLIEELYPNEKRPGLILGQLDTFYNKMQLSDYVVIPSEGCKEITIGIIGECFECVTRTTDEDEDKKSSYIHKRSVEWMKTVKSWQDIYLFKKLLAQQTISDITEDAKLVFRNLFPVYISEDTIHISFQKENEKDLSLANNVDLQSGILGIMDDVTMLFQVEGDRDKVCVKTAVGSPGFIEMICPGLPVYLVAITLIIRIVTGETKSKDGSVSSGIVAIINTVNNLVNDYHNRKKTDAEILQIEANTNLTNAQADKVKAEAEKLRAEIKGFSVPTEKTTPEISEHTGTYEQIAFDASGKTTAQMKEEQEQLTLVDNEFVQLVAEHIESCEKKICEAAENSGMMYNGEKIRKVD